MLAKMDQKQQKNIIFIIAVVLITLFFSNKILNAQKIKLNLIKENIKNYQKKIDLVGEAKGISVELVGFNSMSWPAKEMPSIMGEINELAGRYDIEISNFEPQGTIERNRYFTLGMNLNIRADYFNLARFLSAIEKLNTLTKITSFKLTPEYSSDQENEYGPVVLASIDIEAYYIDKN